MLRPPYFVMALVIAGCGSGEPPSAPVVSAPTEARASAPSVSPEATAVPEAQTIGATCGRLVMCADFNAGRPRPTVEDARACLERWISPCEDALSRADPASPERAMNATLVCERRVTLDVLTSVPDIARRLRLEDGQPLDVEEWPDEDRSPQARAAREAFARCFEDAR